MAVQLTPRKDPLANWDSMPLSHARIGHTNLLVSADTTDAEKALTPNTWERHRPGSGSYSMKFQLISSTPVDYIALAAHNLVDVPITFKYATTVGGSLTAFAIIHPLSTGAMMVLLKSPITMAEIEVSGFLGTNSEVGVLHAGKSLQMYQPIYGGHRPADLNSKTEYQSVMSESGQWLGRSIMRQGNDTQFSWRHLDPDWYRQRFAPFAERAKKYPFFIKWRPDLYDNAVYAHTTDDISPSNMGGGHNLMTVSMNVRGHDDV